MFLAIFLGIFAAILFVYYHWTRRHLYKLSWQLPGPLAYPLVGNGFDFLGPTKDLLSKMRQLASQHKHPLRVWLGPKLFVYFSDAHHIQKVLTSAKLTRKDKVYNFMKPIVGTSLINGSGLKWKMHKKVIQPLLIAELFTQNTEVISKHLEKCLVKLQEYANGQTFNINEMIRRYLSNIMTELLMGESFDIQSNHSYKDFHEAAAQSLDVVFERIMKPWLHPQTVFNLTEVGQKTSHIQRTFAKVLQHMVDKSRARISLRQSQNDPPIIDKLMSGGTFTDSELRDEIITLYLGREDTIASTISTACVCFGMYPEYQQIAYKEVLCVCEDRQTISINDLPRLKYLDMCIKDVLRLTPVGPYIIRQPDEPFEIDGLTIPRDCGVIVSIMDAHYDQSHWANPDHFHPDHFLPEAVKARHPYAYVPFSAGPRGCVGRVFANVCLRMIVAEMLRNFEFEADGKFTDLKLRTDISVRPVDGYMVRLKRRC